MKAILQFTCKNGRGRGKGLLMLYILHTLQKSPKSGYEIINEIREKTGGRWMPSKGTVYPLLAQLEREKMIRVLKTEKRSKKIFCITERGRKVLTGFRARRAEAIKNFEMLRGILVELLGKREVDELLFMLWQNAAKAYECNPLETRKVIENCISALGEINERN
jgi:DNA-binding PadR family transcriptional regulator